MGLSCHINFVSYLEGWVWKIGEWSRLSICCQRASRIWASKGKGRWDGSLKLFWDGERPKGTMGLPYMASNGLIFKDFFGKAQTFKKAKGRSLVQS